MKYVTFTSHISLLQKRKREKIKDTLQSEENINKKNKKNDPTEYRYV